MIEETLRSCISHDQQKTLFCLYRAATQKLFTNSATFKRLSHILMDAGRQRRCGVQGLSLRHRDREPTNRPQGSGCGGGAGGFFFSITEKLMKPIMRETECSVYHRWPPYSMNATKTCRKPFRDKNRTKTLSSLQQFSLQFIYNNGYTAVFQRLIAD